MKRRDLWRPLCVGASLALLGAAGDAGENAGGETSLSAVRAQVRAYEQAWNTHDASAVAAFYSDDADMVMGNGPRIDGRDAIAEWWTRYFSAISDNRAGTFRLESLRLLAPDVSALRGLPAEGEFRLAPGIDRR